MSVFAYAHVRVHVCASTFLCFHMCMYMNMFSCECHLHDSSFHSFLVYHILIFNLNVLLSIFDIYRTNSSLLITFNTFKNRTCLSGTGAQKPYIDLSTETCGKEMCINEGVKDFQW
jgi:hypothetical protein